MPHTGPRASPPDPVDETTSVVLSMIEDQLASLGVAIGADESLLFERTSFLVVSKWASAEGECNPYPDRFERLRTILQA